MKTNTTSRPKRSSSPGKRSSKSVEPISAASLSSHWPFARVDGKILERMHKTYLINNQEKALL